MHIRSLGLQNFRCYSELTLHPGEGLNILTGKNAQGKSSILEAIYLLATARSWRAGKDSELIQWDADFTRIVGDVARREQNDIEVEIIIGRVEKKQVRINTIRQTRLADVLGQVNALFIGPQDSEIIAGEPSERRRFLNLEISQLQPQYCHLLVSYKKVLDQRNRLLRDLAQRGRCDGVLDVLDEQLVLYGSQILERRLTFLTRATDLARVIHSKLTDDEENLDIEYKPSIGVIDSPDIAGRFRERLREVRSEELRRGVTLVGPQRDEMVFTANGMDVRTYGSQGQQRTVALSLRLAELEMMEETAHEPPIVLLDDVMTDLDEERRTHVFELTIGRCQTFATTTSLKFFEAEFVGSASILEVEKGTIKCA